MQKSHQSFFRKWIPLIVLSLALAIIVIDTTFLNSAFSTILRDFNTTAESLQWVISAYALVLAALTITGGRIGDLFGRKKMFMIGAGIFAVGSFIASISPNVGVMILGEAIIEGIGAALMLPATASLLIATYKGRDRALSFGIWGGIAAASSSIGPIFGGYLTEAFSWRWGFRINVVIAAVLIATSIFFIKESIETVEKHTIDFVGVVLSAVSLFLIVFGFIESTDYGWVSASKNVELFGSSFTIFGLSFVPFVILFGALGLFTFYLWEKHMDRLHKTALVSMHIFENKTFTAGVITTAIMSLGMLGMSFVLTVFVQSVFRLGPLQTGVTFLPLSLPLLVTAPLSGYVSGKYFPPKRIIQAGLVVAIVAINVLSISISKDATTTSLIPGLILFGIGMGFVFAQINNVTLSSVGVQQAGEASGVNNTFRQVGATLGSAVIGALMLMTITSHLQSGVEQSSVIPAQLKQTLSGVVSSQASAIEFGAKTSFPQGVSPTVLDEITNISHQATVDGAHLALFIASLFIYLAFLATFALPNDRVIEHRG